jgi:hypothetical protein
MVAGLEIGACGIGAVSALRDPAIGALLSWRGSAAAHVRAGVVTRAYDARCTNERSSTRMTPDWAARRATSTCSESAARASRYRS